MLCCRSAYVRDTGLAACSAHPASLLSAWYTFQWCTQAALHTAKWKYKRVVLCSLGRMPLAFPDLLLCISLFCLLCLSLTQLRVLGRNPASYAEAHSLSHSLGLPCQPGRLHAAEASWPSSPAPAESQRHVMPSGCPPARFPTVLGLR